MGEWTGGTMDDPKWKEEMVVAPGLTPTGRPTPNNMETALTLASLAFINFWL